ncbi:MAG: helix-turn-helix domain-containing protein [Rikenellaceae bacterium]|nr:helix-turn-helix domain-containing protein [Rikenellaceae bacterium]
MIIDFPKLDIPVDFISSKNIDFEILEYYTKFPCRIKSAIFFLCTDGEITVTINLSDYTFQKGDFTFLIPDSFIQLQTISREFKFSFVAFSSGFLEKTPLLQSIFELIPVINIHPVKKLNETEYNTQKRFFDFLAYCFSDGSYLLTPNTIQSVFNILIEQVKATYQAQYHADKHKMSREYQIYMEFSLLLRQNFTAQHHLSFYADKMGLSLQHLSRVIKKMTGKNATKIIDSLLLMEAKSRLKFSSAPIKTLASDIGFTNTSFFYRWFKTRTGLTPQQYKEEV